MAASAPVLSDCDVLGRCVGFSAVFGEVVAVAPWTETQGSSPPCAVQVFGDEVRVATPRVWATAAGRRTMWIRTAAGQVPVPVPETLAVRPGHRVHALVVTSLGRADNQWTAVCNHDTRLWAQVDRYPPCGCAGAWTSFLVGVGNGVGKAAMGFVLFYGLLFALLCLSLGSGLGGTLEGALVGCAVAATHAGWAGSRADWGAEQYNAGVRAACDEVFAEHAPRRRGNA